MGDANDSIRTASFTIATSTSLREPTALPDLNNWEMDQNNVVLKSKICSYTKSKGFLFQRISSLAARQTFISKDGFLILYEKQNKGFVFDLSSTLSISSETSRYKGKKKVYKRRCHMKLKFRCGNVHLFLLDDEIREWSHVISELQFGKPIFYQPPTEISVSFDNRSKLGEVDNMANSVSDNSLLPKKASLSPSEERQMEDFVSSCRLNIPLSVLINQSNAGMSNDNTIEEEDESGVTGDKSFNEIGSRMSITTTEQYSDYSLPGEIRKKSGKETGQEEYHIKINPSTPVRRRLYCVSRCPIDANTFRKMN